MTRRRYLTAAEKALVLKRQDFICACSCAEKITDVRDLQFDHALALHLGGTNDLENFRALKRKHHFAKSGRENSARLKGIRIRGQKGLLRKKPSKKEKVLARMLGLAP